MKRLLQFLFVVTLGCSTKDTPVESAPHTFGKEFADLNESEKLGVFSQIGEEFKGDFRKYSGQNKDSTKIQLALNKDKRFAIGFKFFVNEKFEKHDSMFTFQFVNTGEFRNLCIGHWIDEGPGDKIKNYAGTE